MKRIVICCDGTWQSLDADWPTNVQRVAQFVKPSSSEGVAQVLYYDAGVGLRNKVDRLSGGAFGHGLDAEIREAYRFLSLNYENGDEIYLFGFSRGAYTVRSLAGLIYSCGVVTRSKLRSIPYAMTLYRDREIRPADDECANFRITNSVLREDDRPLITFLGCWDTVGALGLPDMIPFLQVDDWLGARYEFHDTDLGSHILHARHAVAIDEHRKVFDVTPMGTPRDPADGHDLKELWFPGNHGCVGGGVRAARELSDGPLLWMIDEAEAVGLEFDKDQKEGFTRPNPLIDFEDRTGLLFQLAGQSIIREPGPKSISEVSTEAQRRWAAIKEYRPETISKVMPPTASVEG